jgi:hypothetical protein
MAEGMLRFWGSDVQTKILRAHLRIRLSRPIYSNRNKPQLNVPLKTYWRSPISVALQANMDYGFTFSGCFSFICRNLERLFERGNDPSECLDLHRVTRIQKKVRICLQGATLVAHWFCYCYVIRECFQSRLNAVTTFFCYSCSMIRSHSQLFLRPLWLCHSYTYKCRVTVFETIGPVSCSLYPCRNGRNIPSFTCVANGSGFVSWTSVPGSRLYKDQSHNCV